MLLRPAGPDGLHEDGSLRIMTLVPHAWPTVAPTLVFVVLLPAAAGMQQPGLPDAAGTAVQAAADSAPTEATLGFPVYPTARFLTSYDAGRGQRYYLFGTDSDFADMVNYYRLLLDERGDRVFDEPATHIFEVGRFRESTMAFPPGVTIKDYAWNGSEGYLHVGEAGPERYRTIIQIVPSPTAAGR